MFITVRCLTSNDVLSTRFHHELLGSHHSLTLLVINPELNTRTDSAVAAIFHLSRHDVVTLFVE